MPGKTLYCLGEAWLELNSTAPLASAETFSPRMGGSAASLALAYAAQGGRASLLTQLGEDAFGHRIADALSTAGVDVSRVCFTSRAPTPLLFDGGGETLACRTRSSELLYAPEQLGADWAADAEMLAFSSACLVDSPCRYTHLAALDTARTAGVPVCFVPSLRPALWPGEKTLRDTVMQFLPFADILVLGDVPQSPISRNFNSHHMVGQNGLEPSTSRLSVVCSSQLSYWPMWWRLRESNP